MDKKMMALLAADPQYLSRYQIGGLSQDQIGGLSQDQIGWLSQDQIGGLSQDQLKIIKKYRDILDDLPVLDKPYSAMLAKIKTREIKHDQSTFGDDDPAKNTCGTSMCTAGHLVFQAGEAGIAAAKAFGYKTAARAIHFKAHPNHPPQNFGSIPQDYALAYIEDMAEKENALL